MKQQETKKFTVGEYDFHIHPFSAFKSANLSGELIAIASPLIAGLAPMIMKESDPLNMNIDSAMPGISQAFESISGDNIEMILKKLLVSKNIVVELDKGDTWLDEDIANEIFCGNVQDMFILAFHVIQVNYSGFFGKLSNQSGAVVSVAMAKLGK